MHPRAAAMKFRTWLLIVCMVVVPALAMFSHHVPPGVRRSLRDAMLRWTGGGAAPVREPSADRAAAPPAAPTAADGGAVTIPLDEIPARLAELGAVAVQCVPLPGPAGLHLASCQVPLDRDAQLHRVFQAEGIGPEAAANELLEQVASWRLRRDDRPVPGPLGTAPGRVSVRF